MLKIKLARFGKRNQPHFRIVVNEARSKRDGEAIALLGHYAPTQTPKLLQIDIKLYKEWVAKGAQPTDSVASLARRFESGNPFPEKKKELSKKAKAKLVAAKEEAKKPKAEKVEEAPEAPVEEAETPTEETEVVEAETPVEETPAVETETEVGEAPTEEKTEQETTPVAEKK